MQHLRVLPQDQTYLQIEKYRDLDRQIKALEVQKKAVGDDLKAGYFLHHTDYVWDGRLIATYRPEVQVRFNQKKLEDEMPDIFKAYQTLIEFRKFLLK